MQLLETKNLVKTYGQRRVVDGLSISVDDVVNTGREALRDELKYNEGTEFSTVNAPDPEFVRNEPVAPMNAVFDVDADQVAALWEKVDTISVFG